jgi:hypothetical protein
MCVSAQSMRAALPRRLFTAVWRNAKALSETAVLLLSKSVRQRTEQAPFIS